MTSGTRGLIEVLFLVLHCSSSCAVHIDLRRFRICVLTQASQLISLSLLWCFLFLVLSNSVLLKLCMLFSLVPEKSLRGSSRDGCGRCETHPDRAGLGEPEPVGSVGRGRCQVVNWRFARFLSPPGPFQRSQQHQPISAAEEAVLASQWRPSRIRARQVLGQHTLQLEDIPACSAAAPERQRRSACKLS